MFFVRPEDRLCSKKNFLRPPFSKERSYDCHKKTQRSFCPLSIATWWLSYSTKHRQGNFFHWKSSFFLETSNFQQPVRRNRNDGKTCTFSAWILCEVKKNVPRSLPNSMIWENLGQIVFSLNFRPFFWDLCSGQSLTCYRKYLNVAEYLRERFVKPRKVLAFVAKFNDSRKVGEIFFSTKFCPFLKIVFSTRFYVLEDLF